MSGTVPTASSALTYTERAERSVTFEGAGCGSEAVKELLLPANAKPPLRPISPQLGEKLIDDFWGVPAATVTAVRSPGRAP